MSAERQLPRLALIGACVIGLVGAGALSGCGTEGELVRPAPLYGKAAKRAYDADTAAGRTRGSSDLDAAGTHRSAGATDSSGTTSDDDAPKTTRDIQDPAQKLTPLSAAPIEGPPNPLGPPVSTRPPG